MTRCVLIQAKDSKEAYRINYADLRDSFETNFQLNSNYEVTFTLTYIDQYKDVFNAAKPKARVLYDGQWYVIQQSDSELNDKGLMINKITATHELIDKMRNIRLDTAEPTEDNPNTSGGQSTTPSTDKGDQPDVVVKKTDEQQTYPLNDRLDKFFKDNDQKIKYELHGKFPEAAVDCTGSLYEWLSQYIKNYYAYWIPDGDTLKVYDLDSLQHKTGRQFRYLNNMTEADVQIDVNAIVNDCMVYGGKMEKDITTGGGSGGGGDLDSVYGFCKSPINADFGVNKALMLQNFYARSTRARAWGVDVNRLYDVVKQNGISPEWFFAYEIQEQLSPGLGWLNHTYRQGDAYQDAAAVCTWIKSVASGSQPIAWWAAEGSISPNAALAAQWNKDFGNGTIGHAYIRLTAAAVWELAGQNPNPYIGKPLSGCVSVIKSWGGHTVQAGSAGGGWAWPFPAAGEGTFLLGQTFGTHPQDGVGRGNGFHDGLDFGAYDHPGSEVHAVHGGKCIISRAWGNGGINWYCVIQDSSGLNVEYQEAFASASDIYVNVGDVVQTGQVIGRRDTTHLHIGITRHSFPEAFAHAFSNDGTWLDPHAMIKNGGGNQGGDSQTDTPTTTTTSQTYYSLSFHYENQDSIKRYGRYKGKNITFPGIYDMDQLKKMADEQVPHDPPTTLTVKNIFESGFKLGDVWRAIILEKNINTDVTLMGIKYKPYSEDNKDASLSFNNTGLTMANVINAIYKDINGINTRFGNVDTFGGFSGREENHFANINTNDSRTFTAEEVQKIKQFTNNEVSDDGDS